MTREVRFPARLRRGNAQSPGREWPIAAPGAVAHGLREAAGTAQPPPRTNDEHDHSPFSLLRETSRRRVLAHRYDGRRKNTPYSCPFGHTPTRSAALPKAQIDPNRPRSALNQHPSYPHPPSSLDFLRALNNKKTQNYQTTIYIQTGGVRYASTKDGCSFRAGWSRPAPYGAWQGCAGGRMNEKRTGREHYAHRSAIDTTQCVWYDASALRLRAILGGW